ncbi:Virulence factors putative positive transcription regulator BvgA [Andreprevotia sp. IGB-42]|uniref:ATP-binding protein n=1 Tax=Andreprevotia sp. IGB-42 TaxID=2497473 RepID=UPI00135BDC86|nr:ATP-binding protein [Andreprevotia sp. IGB-42]KAF0812071.1 Virulence factors putative positive transcription regulator BvgA [Andreprevotia sp. IGB-42]
MSGIVIVDEQPVTRHALRLLMEAEGHQVLAEADNGIDAVQLARDGKAALMILDLAIPRLGGLAVMERLEAMPTRPKVLVLTAQNTEYFALRCLEAGAAGFVSKAEDLDELKVAVNAVLHGHSYFPSHVLTPGNHIAVGDGADATLKELSSRELSVLQLLAKGMSNIAIAGQLALSDKTISTYKIRLKQKLNAGSLLELIDIARRHGLVEGTPDDATPPAQPLDAAQQRELDLLHKMLDALPHAVCVRDPEGRLITCNQHYLQQFRVQLADIKGKRLYETEELATDNARLVHQQLMAAAALRKPYSRDVTLNIAGSEHILRHWGRPYLDEQQRYLGFICGSVEVTDRDQALIDLRNANEKAERASHAKSAFLASMGTEISVPVQSIVAMLDLALAQSPPQQEPLQVARAAAINLRALLDDLQQLSQLEAGKHPLAPRPVDLVTQLAAQLDTYRHEAQHKNLQLQLDTTLARKSMVWVDPQHWQQLVSSLLSNALKFTEQGGITVRLAALGRGQGLVAVTLEVADTGIGIPKDQQQDLFEPFSQRLDSQRIRHGGSGLGLALCKCLVEQMQGTITLHSQPGVGTTFSIALMLTEARI